MAKRKTKTIVEEIKKEISVVIGHKVEDMKYMIDRYTESGSDVLVSTWPRYADEFDLEAGKGFVQKTPEKQGQDCLNLVLTALKPIFYAVPKDKKIRSIGNCHTHPIAWDYDLTCEEWEKLFDVDPNTKEYVNDIVVRRYKELYGTEDINIEDIS